MQVSKTTPLLSNINYKRVPPPKTFFDWMLTKNDESGPIMTATYEVLQNFFAPRDKDIKL